MVRHADADTLQLADAERAAIAKSFSDKSDPKKVISEGVKINGVKYMTVQADDEGFKAKKVPLRSLPMMLVGCSD